jgi:hypothetical protein
MKIWTVKRKKKEESLTALSTVDVHMMIRKISAANILGTKYAALCIYPCTFLLNTL